MTLDGSNLFIGGDFGNVGGEAHQSVASINATTGAVNSAFVANTGVGNAIWSFLEAIAVVGDKVYIGGYFGQVNGVDKNYLAALDKTTGATDASFNPIVTNWVLAITPSTDGSVIYVGGQELSVTTGEDTAYGAAAIDVATGRLTSWRGNTGEVRGISVSDAVVYLAGNFSTVGGLTRENTAAVSTTGNVLEPWPMNAADAKTLEVTIPDTALGAVTSDPGGINCGGSCAYSYSAGSEVVLTAVPDTGYEFEAWTGECTGSSTTCTVTLAESASTVATFRIATVGGNTTPPQTVPGTTPTVTPTPTPTPTPTQSAPATSVSTVKQTVQFAPGNTALDAADKRALDSVVLKAKALKETKISIFGSAQKTSFSKLDKALATARAQAVIAYLRSKGVKATFVVLPAKPASDRSAKGRSVVITVTGTK
jgi:outer membrane protein OmpA-like peptidoglycan-associated protein